MQVKPEMPKRCAESSLRKNNDQGYGGVPMGNHAELAILS